MSQPQTVGPTRRQQPQPALLPPPHALPLSLSLSRRPYLDPFLRSAAAKCLVSHVMFARGIVPVSAGDLVRAASEEAASEEASAVDAFEEADQDQTVADADEAATFRPTTRRQPRRRRRRRRRPRSQKKMIQAGTELMRLLSDLDDIFGCSNGSEGSSTNDDNSSNQSKASAELGWSVKAALITLGPSLRSPREQYLICFHSPPLPATGTDNISSSGANGGGNGGNNAAAGGQAAAPPPPRRPPGPPPPEVRNRLESELSRRTVREFLRGTLEPKYAYGMFSRSGCGGGSSSRRVNVALCLEGGVLRRMLGGGDSEVAAVRTERSTAAATEAGLLNPALRPANAVNTAASSLSRRIVMQRNFALRVPRMISKKRGIHRPFVVLDVIAGGGGGGNAVSTGDGVNAATAGTDRNAFFGTDDEWIVIRSKVKGFRLG